MKRIRNIIRETFEELMIEEYPTSFDMEHFKTLKTFSSRIKYCEENLQRLSSGSSRIVYKIDDEKVLKLAKNAKGLAQNDTEITHGQYSDLKDVVANVFDYDANDLWVEMELAKPLTKGDFKRITGFDFEDFQKAINDVAVEAGYKSMYKKPTFGIDREIIKKMWEDEFINSFFDYAISYELPVGDLKRLNSYGVVKRNGMDAIVVIDFGLTDDVHSTYYSR